MVERFRWDPSCSVGIHELDQQHEKIIELINRLIDQENLTAESELVSGTLQEMNQYARAHFKDEESMLSACGYPQLVEHRDLHVGFLRRTIRLCMEAMEHEDEAPKEILNALVHWWKNHILTEDMKYVEFLSTCRRRRGAA